MEEVTRIPLPVEGLNVVEVPTDGELLTVTATSDGMPCLCFRAERSAARIPARYFVTRQLLESGIGDYVGSGQNGAAAAMHVFEMDSKRAKEPKK